jgi:peptide-methionine (S)-S-oxide reductase
MFFASAKSRMISADEALRGRAHAIPTALHHFVNGAALKGPYPDGAEMAMFGLGCFWGAERIFWKQAGVHVTAVGYAAGFTPNPTYEEVCTGKTGHNEVVLVVFDPAVTSFEKLTRVFFEAHDPTQGMRQGNDAGTQYRSGIYTFSEAQAETARRVADGYGPLLLSRGFGAITTEIIPAPNFYFAEDYHQQNPNGYCGIGGTGVVCAVG